MYFDLISKTDKKICLNHSKLMKKVCFSSPTGLLRRPIAEIVSRLKNLNIGILTPNDLLYGFVNIHYKKVKNAKIHDYKIIHGINSKFLEWPIPVNPFFFIQLFNLIKKYDIIHLWVPFYICNTALAILKRLFFPKKELYITMDTFPGLSFKMGNIFDLFFRIYYKTFGKILFSTANKIILYGNSMVNFALQIGIPKKKIIVLPPGVDMKIKEKDNDIRKEFKIKKNDKIILFIGLLVNDRKGVKTIIKMARKLENQNIKIIIVGDGAKRQNYEMLVKKNNLTDKFIFTGFRKDVHNFYHEADLFFLPSKGEGLAGVIMESMAYGVPVISSNIAGTRDLIKNNYNGFLCEFEDIDCYIDKINILLKNDDIKKKFILNSKEKIKQAYNWDENFEKYKRLYI